MSSELKIKGYIRKWLPTKAFGFITSVDSSGNSQSYFVHVSEIKGIESPSDVNEGVWCMFCSNRGEKGLFATQVELLEEGETSEYTDVDNGSS